MRALVLLAATLSGCGPINRLALPEHPCVAYGASVTLSGVKLSKSAGCIEQAPYPGEQMPPRSNP